MIAFLDNNINNDSKPMRIPVHHSHDMRTSSVTFAASAVGGGSIDMSTPSLCFAFAWLFCRHMGYDNVSDGSKSDKN